MARLNAANNTESDLVKHYLTIEERQAALMAAERYPVGHGGSYFSDLKMANTPTACNRIKANSACIEFG